MFADGDIVIIHDKVVAEVVRTLGSGRIVVRVQQEERTTFTYDEFFDVMMAQHHPAVMEFGIDPAHHPIEPLDGDRLLAMALTT